MNELEDKSVDMLAAFMAAIPANITSVSFFLYELQKMGPEKCQVIQQRFPNAEHILIIIDDNGKPISLRTIMGANVYRRLGFKTTVPSLTNTSAFFIHNNQTAFTEQLEERLPSDAYTFVKQFR